MASENANVIDELVVKLTLDADKYRRVEKEIDGNVDRTEKKQKARDVKRKRADEDQEKRWKDLTASGKAFAASLGRIALMGAAVATAIGGTLTGLTGFELGLRRQAVSTGLSNRQMQAWGATARRMGADADAGQAAIAELAKEQKQFRFTGQAPTLQALARAGVPVSPNMPIPQMLEAAQHTYRSEAPAQRQQMEATLAAQGVSPDLILMIKSNADALQTYSKSYAEATTENRKALDGVSDAMASLKASAISAANTLLILSTPLIHKAAEWLGEAATAASAFSDKVTAAGGGVDGFIAVIDKESPVLGDTLRVVTGLLDGLGQVVDVVAYGLKEMAWLIDQLPGMGKGKGGWASVALHAPAAATIAFATELGKKVGPWWHKLVENARANGPAPAAKVEAALRGAPTPVAIAPAVSRGTAVSAQDLMTSLVTRHGLSVGEAAAVVANWQRESSLNPHAFNPANGGQGAMGLAQWRGSRIDAFKARYGIDPDKATVQQQVDFMLHDPFERAKLAQAFAGGGSAKALGESYSRIYEAHGKIAEDRARGALAAQLAAQYRSASPNAPGGSPINIQTVNVQADDATAFVGSMRRIAGPQNYNAAVR